jgi:hypothetical protein
MVISYTQNLYFKIQCRKSKNIIIIHFFILLYFKKLTQQFEYENHCKKFTFLLFTKNFNQNTIKIAMFC